MVGVGNGCAGRRPCASRRPRFVQASSEKEIRSYSYLCVVAWMEVELCCESSRLGAARVDACRFG